MKKTAFTICSNNYMSQALVLRDSFMEKHPEYEFFIGLVDDIKGVEHIYPNLEGIIPVTNLDINEFDEMSNRYNITELNTSVKPFYFEYFFTINNSEWVLYIDPDIYIYDRLNEVEVALTNGAELVLTPHLLSPIGDWDICYIREGIFNLGFAAFRNSLEVNEFIKWWQSKLIHQGYFSYQKNLFYDQLWMNLSISFLREVKIIHHAGYNIAGWNLFERKIFLKNDIFYVNNEVTRLVFFHFSGVTFDNSDKFISKHYPNVTIEDRPDLEVILLEYRKRVISKNYDEIKKIRPKYVPPPQKISFKKKVRFFLLNKIKKLLNPEI